MQVFSRPGSIRASVCSDIQLKVASTREEREATFGLIYNSYRQAGLCAENDCGLRATPYQLLPTTDVIIAELRQEVISTVSLVRDGELGLPMEAIYPAEVAARRAAGVRLAEVSCLADRRQGTARFFGLFCELSRVMAQLANKLSVDELLVVVHPRHAPLYRRYMAFEQIGEKREYSVVEGNPAVALSLNFAKALAERPKKWHEFFGHPLPAHVLQSCPIAPADREYFSSLLERGARPDQCFPLGPVCYGSLEAEEERLLCA